MALDKESAAALGYARADINSPADHADSGSRVFPSRERAPASRRGMIPVHACPGATEALKRLAANSALGDVVDESCEQNRVDIAALNAKSYPVGDVPWERLHQPTMVTRSAAAFLGDHLAAVINGKLADQDVELRVAAAFEAFFDFLPEQAWLPPLLVEIRRAALERLNYSRRVAKLNESKRAAFPEPPELRVHADLVIQRTRSAVASAPMPCDLPEWLDGQLVAYMIPRFGFGSGKGGASRVITQKTMTRLLASPRLMIKDLTRSSKGAVRWKSHIRLLRSDPTFSRRR